MTPDNAESFFYTVLFICLVAMNLLSFIAFGIDKSCARHKLWRIPEVYLLLLAACGGSIGAWIAMYTFRHKTQHLKFRYGVPALLVLQLAAAAFFLLK